MATMSATAGNRATCTVQPLHPTRSAHRTASLADTGTRAPERRLMQAADATMHFALALMPFSTLVWVFVAH